MTNAPSDGDVDIGVGRAWVGAEGQALLHLLLGFAVNLKNALKNKVYLEIDSKLINNAVRFHPHQTGTLFFPG